MVELKNPDSPFDSTEIDNKLFIIPALVVGGIICWFIFIIQCVKCFNHDVLQRTVSTQYCHLWRKRRG